MISSNPILTNVAFLENSAVGGGGLYNKSSNPEMRNGIFAGNSTIGGGIGGGMNNDTSNPLLTNVTFVNNTALYGGGIYNFTSNPTLVNVTLVGNSAPNGGGMYNFNNNPTIYNGIFWGNTPTNIFNNNATGTVRNSIVEEGCPVSATCTNVSTANPFLGTLGFYGSSIQTIPLLPNSPAIDAGDAAYCPTQDQRGMSRVDICDIGAFEFAGLCAGDYGR